MLTDSGSVVADDVQGAVPGGVSKGVRGKFGQFGRAKAIRGEFDQFGPVEPFAGESAATTVTVTTTVASMTHHITHYATAPAPSATDGLEMPATTHSSEQPPVVVTETGAATVPVVTETAVGSVHVTKIVVSTPGHVLTTHTVTDAPAATLSESMSVVETLETPVETLEAPVETVTETSSGTFILPRPKLCSYADPSPDEPDHPTVTMVDTTSTSTRFTSTIDNPSGTAEPTMTSGGNAVRAAAGVLGGGALGVAAMLW